MARNAAMQNDFRRYRDLNTEEMENAREERRLAQEERRLMALDRRQAADDRQQTQASLAEIRRALKQLESERMGKEVAFLAAFR